MTHQRLLGCFLLASLAVTAACGGDSTVEVTDPALSIASGDGQSHTVAEALANPLVVQVLQGGSPVSGVTITWSVQSGGGSVDPGSATTGGDGRASTAWTLGPNPGANTARASASGVTGSPKTFTATGTSATPPMTAEVTVNDNFFEPSSVTIAAGGTVNWTWVPAVSNSHNVTFSTGTNSATQASGTFSRSFPTAGTYNYNCTIHGVAMSGTVVVE